MKGRVAIITGASRRAGIGFAVARRLAVHGVKLFVHSWAPFDELRAFQADPEGILADLRALGGPVEHASMDFEEPAAPAELLRAAVDAFGHVDLLIANHAYSLNGGLGELNAEHIDRHLQVNVRATLLLVQAFAAQHDGREGGRVILFSSGQHLAPMSGELAYAASKGALHQLTGSLSAELIGRGITVNTVNPGPTDTGWANAETEAAVQALMPLGRWGQPDDAARLIEWLCSDDGRWVSGQVIDSEGGFRRG